MRLTIAIVICLSTLNVFGQCTFERFWDYYTWPAGTKSRVLPLSDGGYLVYCTAEYDSVTYGNAQTHLIQFKTDACGTKLWTNDSGYIGDGDPDMTAIEMEDGNYMIVGYTAAGLPGSLGNIRVGKYSRNGQLLKEKLLIGEPVSGVYGALKNTFKNNSYYVYGHSYNPSTDQSKPLVVEIDCDLNAIRRKKFGARESIAHLVIKDSNTLIGIHGTDTSSAILVLDSTFNINEAFRLNHDSLTYVGIYVSQLFWSQDSTSLIGCGRIKKKSESFEKECLMQFDLAGNMKKIVYFTGDSIPTSMNQTKDGGYILGGWYFTMKVDSDFNIQWQKEVRGRIYSIAQTFDGGYVASGLSSEQIYGPFSKPYFRPYLVKMDSEGNFLKTGIEEKVDSGMHTVTVYPNPANASLNIHTVQMYKTAQVYSLMGNEVLRQNYLAEQTNMDVSTLASGLYILTLVDEYGKMLHTQKLSIQR